MTLGYITEIDYNQLLILITSYYTFYDHILIRMNYNKDGDDFLQAVCTIMKLILLSILLVINAFYTLTFNVVLEQNIELRSINTFNYQSLLLLSIISQNSYVFQMPVTFFFFSQCTRDFLIGCKFPSSRSELSCLVYFRTLCPFLIDMFLQSIVAFAFLHFDNIYNIEKSKTGL